MRGHAVLARSAIEKWVVWDRELDGWLAGYFYSRSQATTWIETHGHKGDANFYPLLWETKNP